MTAEGHAFDKRAIARHIAGRLTERYKVPLTYRQVARIERTDNGKLNRKFYTSRQER